MVDSLEGVTVRRGGRAALLAASMIAAAALGSFSPTVLAQSLEESFRLLDANGDGRVGAEEFANQKIRFLDMVDANGDGFIEPGESMLSTEEFEQADSDGDGKISDLEFIDSPFHRLETYDAEGKGYITLEDLERALER